MNSLISTSFGEDDQGERGELAYRVVSCGVGQAKVRRAVHVTNWQSEVTLGMKKIDPTSYEMLDVYAHAVGQLSILSRANASDLHGFLIYHYCVDLDQISNLHTQYLGAPIEVDNSDAINAGIESVLAHLSARNMSTQDALMTLFPRNGKEAVSRYCHEASVTAFTTEMHCQQLEYLRDCEAEDWAHQ